jgi:hypothetical protein
MAFTRSVDLIYLSIKILVHLQIESLPGRIQIFPAILFTGFEQGAHFTLTEKVYDFVTTLLGFNKGMDFMKCSE